MRTMDRIDNTADVIDSRDYGHVDYYVADDVVADLVGKSWADYSAENAAYWAGDLGRSTFSLSGRGLA